MLNPEIGETHTSQIAKSDNTMVQTAISNRVLKSSRLEQQIFKELRRDNAELQAYEQEGLHKLPTFGSLVNDTFQSFYSLSPKFVEDEELSTTARKLNKHIVTDIMGRSEYSVMKTICEGREIPAMAATGEFTETILGQLDELLRAASGEKDSLHVLEKIESQRDECLEQLSELQKRAQNGEDGLEEQIVSAVNKANSKCQQAEVLGNIVDRNLQKNKVKFNDIISSALKNAQSVAESTSNAIAAWGDGSGEMKRTPLNMEILQKVKGSEKLRTIAAFLGRFKEMLNSKRKNGFTYGRGEKYDIEFGNSLSKSLTSELAFLAAPELVPVFMRKYGNKKLKQYRKRETRYSGGGDIVVCLDESGSTWGENSAWGMAVAILMLEICRVNKRNFALVHFASETKTDIYLAKDTDISDRVFETAETFLNGGTDFEKPLAEAIRLMDNNCLEKPDVVFITDGNCQISEAFEEQFAQKKVQHGFTVTGILLDKGIFSEFSLEGFCNDIYRTSELCQDEIVNRIINKNI